MFLSMLTAFLMTSANGIGLTDTLPTTERRRGFGIVFCTGICTAACAVGTGGIGFPTPAGVACEFVCVSACTASTACFDENAEVRTFDESSGKMVSRRISELVNQDEDPEVQTADFLGDGTHLKAATETLDAVVAIEGDWTFYEIIAETGDVKDLVYPDHPFVDTVTATVALNTTDDHGWIVVDSDGSDGCVVHAAEVAVGDHVLVFLEDRMTPSVAQVVAIRTFQLPVKYAAYTDSGMLVANGVLTTVFCDHSSDDCAANVTLRDRLAVWKQRHQERVRSANEQYLGLPYPERVAGSPVVVDRRDEDLRDEIHSLGEKVDKMQKTLKRFKKQVAESL